MMSKIWGTIICPECGDKILIENKIKKKHIMGNIFSHKTILCSNCSHIIDLDLVYRELMEYDFDDVLDPGNDENTLSNTYETFEVIESAIGKSSFLSVKKELALLRMLYVSEKIDLEKYINLFSILSMDLSSLISMCKKTVTIHDFYKDIQENFYIPTNILTQKKSNVLTTEYLLDYLSLAGFFVIGDIFEQCFYEDKKENIKQKIQMLKLMVDIMLSVYEFMEHYEFMDWSLELDFINILIDMVNELCGIHLYKGKYYGLSLNEKKFYLEKYDTVLKPRQKTIMFENVPHKLFLRTGKTELDREDFGENTGSYDEETLKKRYERNQKRNIENEIVCIRNCMLNSFLKEIGIKEDIEKLLKLRE